MEYISKHKINNITATLPMSFLFLLQLIIVISVNFFMYNCFNYNQNINVYRYTKHVYLKKERTQKRYINYMFIARKICPKSKH